MEQAYDSYPDTLEHIHKVRKNLATAKRLLSYRAEVHDASKLSSEEKPLFDEMTPKLAALSYGSQEYKEALKRLGQALEHHYSMNSHHPEHYPDGVADMTLLDLIEMLCDWTAAVERHDDGDLRESFKINKKRFQISDELYGILERSAAELQLFVVE